MVSRRPNCQPALVLGAALILAAVLYAPTWTAGTAYEDAHWQQALRSGLTWSLPGAITSKPLAAWTLRWSIPAEHLVNVALHLANGALVYVLASLVVTPVAGAAAAVIFLLAPLQSEAVIYLSARSDLLITLCALIAAVASLQRSAWVSLLAPVAAVAAVWCDQVGLLVVPVVWLTLRRWQPRARRRDLSVAVLLTVAAVLVALAGPMILTEWQIAYTVEGANLAWPVFLVLQATALWHLLALIVDPRWLSIDHEIVGLGLAWTVWAILATTVTLTALVLSWRRSPVTAWALACLVLSVAPHFIFRTNEWLSEHQLYLAMVWVSIGLGAGAVWVHHHVDRLVASVAGAWRDGSLFRHLSIRSV